MQLFTDPVFWSAVGLAAFAIVLLAIFVYGLILIVNDNIKSGSLYLGIVLFVTLFLIFYNDGKKDRERELRRNSEVPHQTRY